MEGRSIDYQKFDKKLSKSLKRYILTDEKNILIGMPGKYLKGTGINLLKSRVHFSSWTHVRYYYKNFLSMYKEHMVMPSYLEKARTIYMIRFG